MDENISLERKKLTPFDYVKSITDTKDDLMVDEQTEKWYVPFVVNMNLSTDPVCMIMANEMNTRPHIPNCGQYKFLMNAILKKKRYLKYPKGVVKMESLDIVKKYYNISTVKAIDVLSILTDEQVSVLQDRMDVGGKR